MGLFKKIRTSLRDSKELRIECDSCHESIHRKELANNLGICPKCGYYFKVSVDERIAFTFDKGFEELFSNIAPEDFLNFKDTKAYSEKLQETKQATNRNDAVVCVQGKINGINVLAAIFDFKFLGGTLGSVVGEKITRILKKGAKEKIPVIVFCASGGARMQEGIMSLMQMPKVTSAIRELKTAKVPYITVLIDPTLGGVSASIAMLGDFIFVEPKATIGFAGPRVIEETIGKKLPKEFQKSEYLFKHGLVDQVIPRNDMKRELTEWLSLFVKN
jgi:acetyl-CoA carboxylase carboxyl transferase subunit beta